LRKNSTPLTGPGQQRHHRQNPHWLEALLPARQVGRNSPIAGNFYFGGNYDADKSKPHACLLLERFCTKGLSDSLPELKCSTHSIMEFPLAACFSSSLSGRQRRWTFRFNLKPARGYIAPWCTMLMGVSSWLI